MNALNNLRTGVKLTGAFLAVSGQSFQAEEIWDHRLGFRLTSMARASGP